MSEHSDSAAAQQPPPSDPTTRRRLPRTLVVFYAWLIVAASLVVFIYFTSRIPAADLAIDHYTEGEGFSLCVELGRRFSSRAELNNRIAWITGFIAALIGLVGGILGPEPSKPGDGLMVRYIKPAQGVIWLPLSGMLVVYMSYRMERARADAAMATKTIRVIAQQPEDTGRKNRKRALTDASAFSKCMAVRAEWEIARVEASAHLDNLGRNGKRNGNERTNPLSKDDVGELVGKNTAYTVSNDDLRKEIKDLRAMMDVSLQKAKAAESKRTPDVLAVAQAAEQSKALARTSGSLKRTTERKLAAARKSFAKASGESSLSSDQVVTINNALKDADAALNSASDLDNELKEKERALDTSIEQLASATKRKDKATAAKEVVETASDVREVTDKIDQVLKDSEKATTQVTVTLQAISESSDPPATAATPPPSKPAPKPNEP